MEPKKRTHIVGSFAAALKVSVALVCAHLCENRAIAATQKDLLTTATNISAGTSYVGGGTPLTTWDVTWTNSTYSATTFLLNSNLSIGTLNDLNASQALTLTNNGTANTTLTLYGGTDAVSGSAAGDLIYVAANGRLTIQNGTRTLNLALAASGNFNTGAGASLTIASVISGTANITKTGAGTTTLTGANTFTGNTTVSAGVLNIQNATALGTTGAGTTVNAGAALQVQGSIAVGAEALTLNGSGIANDGALRSMSGNNSWAGAVTLGSASTIASDSGTLTLSGALNNGGFAVTYGGAGNITPTGIISGAGGLTKNGAGTLTLSSANTFTGAVAINGGVVAIQNAGAFGTAANTASTTVASGAALLISNNITTTNTGTLVLNGAGAGAGALQSVSGSNAWNSNVTIASNTTIGSSTAGTRLTIGNATPSNFFAIGGNTVTFDGAGDTWLNSNIGVAGDTGGVVKNGTGRLIFYGTDTNYSGSTTVNAGSLELVVGPFSGASLRGINGPLTIGTGPANSALAGTVKVNIWSSSYDNQISSSSAVTINSDGALNLGATPMINGAGTTGSTTLGTLTLNGGQVTMTSALSITPSGGITTNVNSAHQTAQITGGTLNIGAPTIFSVARDSTITSDLTVTSIVAGGSLTKQGAGVMTLTGANTFTGATIVDGGVLNIQNATGLGTTAGGTTVNAGAALQIQGNISVGVEPLSLNGSGVASDGALRVISGNATWLGPLTLGSASTIAVDTGTLTLSGTMNNGGFLATYGGAGNITASGSISGAGGLTKTGSGSLTLSTANTFGGTTTISAGTVVLQNNLSLQNSTLDTSGAGVVNAGGLATPTFGGLIGSKNLTSVITGGYTGISALTLNVGTGITDSYSGIIANGAGATTLTKTGLGTQILSGANAYTGATTVSSGVLNIQNAAALGTTAGTAAVNAGAALQVQGNIAVGAEALTLNGGGIAGDGALRNVSGNNSWAGAVTLGSASTIASDSGALALSGTLNNAGFAATFSGAGNITASGTISGTGGLVKSGTGTLTVTGANTMTGGVAINSGTIVAGNNSAFGPLATQMITFNGGKLASDNAARSLANNLIVNPASGNGITGANSLTLTGTASANGELDINFGNAAAVLTVNPTAANSFAPGLIRLTSGTLLLGGSDKIGNTTGLALAGGKLNTGGFSDQLGALTIQASSTIDFGTTNNVHLQFSSAAWGGGTLNVANWTGSAIAANNADQLLFSGAVSNDVLNHIAFAGYGPGAIAFDRGNGLYEVAPVPEPATVFGALGLAGFVAFRERRRILRAVGTACRH